MEPSSLVTTPISNRARPAARRVAEHVARAAVPRLADFCVVHLISGRTLAAVAAAHARRQGDRLVRALMHAHRIRPDDPDSTVAQVVRSGRPIVRSAISTAADDEGPVGGVADLHRRLAPVSALVVPIVHARTVLGVISLCYSHSSRHYSERHLPAAMRLAKGVAAALMDAQTDAPFGLRSATRHARQGTAIRRRLAARN